MTHTSIDHTAELVPHRANGYRWDGETVINTPNSDPEYGMAAGALRSTVDDLFRFDRVLKEGKLFSPAVTAKAWTAYGHLVAPPPLPIESDYGYGWMVGQEFGHRYLGHGGWVTGFVSHFMRYPDDDAVLIVLFNFEAASYTTLSSDLAAILFGQKYEVPVMRPIVHPTHATLARYVGDYQIGPYTVKFTLRNDKLYALGTGQPTPYGLIATSDTEFYCNEAVSVIRFVPDEKGNVNRIAVKMMGREMELTRVAPPGQGE
jgi:hypothetical protein